MREERLDFSISWQNSAGISTGRPTKRNSFETMNFDRNFIFHMNVPYLIISSLFIHQLELRMWMWRWKEQWILCFWSVRKGINLLMFLHSNPAFTGKSKTIWFIFSAILSRKGNPGLYLEKERRGGVAHKQQDNQQSKPKSHTMLENLARRPFCWSWSTQTCSQSIFFQNI